MIHVAIIGIAVVSDRFLLHAVVYCDHMIVVVDDMLSIGRKRNDSARNIGNTHYISS